MDQKSFEKQSPFAGAPKPSMKRCAVDHDYHERRIYMITIAVEGRRPLLGQLKGDVLAQRGTPDFPHVVPTELGEAVSRVWQDIPRYHPEVRVLAFQLMPDHIHGILFVERPIEVGLGRVVLGFKQGCNKAYRSLLAASVGSVAVPQQQNPIAVIPQHTQQNQNAGGQSGTKTGGQLGNQQGNQPGRQVEGSEQGYLFERGYHDCILPHAGQLETLRAYIADNPYRLALKRAHADLLRVRENVVICGRNCSVVGNMDLLHAERRLQVRFSRSISPELLQQESQQLLSAARAGAVLVSPAISPGEKAAMRAAFDAHLPLIVLLDNGLDPLSKPSGQRFYATAEGRLLLISPFPHSGEKKPISRDVCNQLNALAWDITHTNSEKSYEAT